MTKYKQWRLTPVTDQRATDFLDEHAFHLAGVMGVVDHEYLAVRAFMSPEAFGEYAADEYRRTHKSYELHGYPAGACNSEAEYGKHVIWLFIWKLETMGQLVDVLMHELAHVATHKINLLHGSPTVMCYVSEQIILPFLNCMYYDPFLKLLQPRRVALEGGGTRPHVDVPRREA